MKRTVPSCKLLSILGGLLTAGIAQATTCPPSDQTGAVPLNWVEPLAEDGRFAVGWDTRSESVIEPHSRPVSGATFEVVRCLPPGRWVPVASGTVQGAVGNFVHATATSTHLESVPIAVASRSANLYWRPMKGDLVRPVETTVLPSMRITPRIVMGWDQIFDRIQGGEFSLDLSESGRAALAKTLRRFRGVRGRLAVECFSHRSGNRDALAQETQIRASVVVQYLTNAFELEPESLLAIGMGANEASSGWRDIPKWPQREVLEGVVVRVLPE